jgi:anti-sigma regulatory factor (Ser/Thr protein kinase)
MATRIKLEIPSDAQLLRIVRGVVEHWCARAGFAEEDCRQVTLAVDEAMANVIRHAYQGQSGQPIALVCLANDHEVEFQIEDRGKPVDRARLAAATEKRPDELRTGGRGAYFIEQIMSQVVYETLPGRNLARLVKYRPAKKEA